jgi:hypothetical protein
MVSGIIGLIISFLALILLILFITFFKNVLKLPLTSVKKFSKFK